MDQDETYRRNARKTLAFAQAAGHARRILVVGCGDGREAGVLARHFGAETVGIGYDDGRFDREAATPAELVEMDARELLFDEDEFDLVYSFHALEHIPGPERALEEIARVLRPDGGYLIGTPNRARLVGYVGAAEPLRDRVRSNLRDYGMRLRGRWTNEAGAHAGFTREQLVQLCRRYIGPATDVTDDYYRRLYPSKEAPLRWLRRTHLSDRVYPAVYVHGRRARTS